MLLSFTKVPLLMISIIFIVSCHHISEETINTKKVNHIVLCWLKESGNLEHRQKIIEASYSFRKIPGVLTVSAGEVISSNRKIVDDTFDVGIIFTFANIEEMNAYLMHPQHQQAVQQVLMPLVKKIVIYDYKE